MNQNHTARLAKYRAVMHLPESEAAAALGVKREVCRAYRRANPEIQYRPPISIPSRTVRVASGSANFGAGIAYDKVSVSLEPWAERAGE